MLIIDYDDYDYWPHIWKTYQAKDQATARQVKGIVLVLVIAQKRMTICLAVYNNNSNC